MFFTALVIVTALKLILEHFVTTPVVIDPAVAALSGFSHHGAASFWSLTPLA